MAITKSTTIAGAGGAISISVTLSNTVTGRTILVGAGMYDSLGTSAAVSDAGTNTFTQRVRSGQNAAKEALIFDSIGATGKVTHTITITFGTSEAGWLEAHEEDAITAFEDADDNAVSAQGPTITTDPAALSAAQGAAYGIGYENNTANMAVDAPWAQLNEDLGVQVPIGDGAITGYRTLSSPGDYSFAANMGVATDSYVSAIAVYSTIPRIAEQSAFLWRNDNGTESGATAQFSQNVNPDTVNANNVARLRVQLNVTSGDPLAGQYQLEYRKVTGDGIWRKVEK